MSSKALHLPALWCYHVSLDLKPPPFHPPLFPWHSSHTTSPQLWFSTVHQLSQIMSKRRSRTSNQTNRPSKQSSATRLHSNSDDETGPEFSDHLSTENLFSSSRVLIPIHSSCFFCARTQKFHIVTSDFGSKVFVLLGTTANKCTMSVTSSDMSCNCPDTHKGCKHILFLCHAFGLIGTGDAHVLIHPPTFQSLMSA